MQTGIHFHEAAGIEETLDPLLGGLWEVMIAMRANPLIFGHFDFVNDFAAAGTFLKEPFRNVLATFSSAASASWGFFENSHDFMRARR
jgi:hypothetical protein